MQKEAVDAAAVRLGGSVARYYVDSGRPDGLVRRGEALGVLVDDARLSSFDIVLVERFGRLSGDFAVAAAVSTGLAEAGVEMIEAADGGLDFSGAPTLFGRPGRRLP